LRRELRRRCALLLAALWCAALVSAPAPKAATAFGQRLLLCRPPAGAWLPFAAGVEAEALRGFRVVRPAAAPSSPGAEDSVVTAAERPSGSEPEKTMPGPQSGQRAQRAPLSSLAEQWGLLGLAVGLAVAFGGIMGGDFDLGLDLNLESLFAGVGGFGGSFAGLEIGQVAQNVQATLEGNLPPEDLESAVEAVTASTAAAPALGEGALALESAAPVLEGDPTAAAAAGATEVGIAEAGVGEAAAALGGVALRAGVAGSFGAVAGYAGLVAEGLKEPLRERERVRFLSLSEFTPGTIHQVEDGEEVGEFDDRPMSAWRLGFQNFGREWKELLRVAQFPGAAPRRHVPNFVLSLVLSNEAVIEREKARPEVPTPGPVRVAYDVLCWFIDIVFEDRPIQRFWFLETVARMPYFAYTSVLHLYETLGWWRSPELRAVHLAEEDNELHHLLIMESLGGDQRWLDRFFAQHGAIAYYWVLVAFFIVDPRWSYNFSRLIESHAIDTYGEFVDANAERLKSLPPPPIAVEYYLTGEPYLFDKFQTARRNLEPRRPPCSTLYDVFSNIRDDEEQHVLTMTACEEWVDGGDPAVPLGFNRLDPDEYARRVSQDPAGRAAWAAWGEEVRAAAAAAGRSGRS